MRQNCSGCCASLRIVPINPRAFSSLVAHRLTCCAKARSRWLAVSPTMNSVASIFPRQTPINGESYGFEAGFRVPFLPHQSGPAIAGERSSCAPISSAICQAWGCAYPQRRCIAFGRCWPTITVRSGTELSWHAPLAFRISRFDIIDGNTRKVALRGLACTVSF